MSGRFCAGGELTWGERVVALALPDTPGEAEPDRWRYFVRAADPQAGAGEWCLVDVRRVCEALGEAPPPELSGDDAGHFARIMAAAAVLHRMPMTRLANLAEPGRIEPREDTVVVQLHPRGDV